MLRTLHRTKTHFHTRETGERCAIAVLLFVIAIIGFSVSSLIVPHGLSSRANIAGSADASLGGDVEGFDKGLVQCGKSGPCTIPDLITTIKRLGAWLLKFILLPLAALSIAIAGIYYVWGAVTPAKIAIAHNIIWDVVIGLVVALAAYTIVKLIFTTLGITGIFQ